MTKDWSLFWVAMAVMALAGAVVTNVLWGRPMEMGALGQWASAFASLAAVAVALWNTKQTLKIADEREVRKQAASDMVYLHAVQTLTQTVLYSLQQADEMMTPGLTVADAREAIQITNLEGLMGAIDRVPIHTAPARMPIVSLIGARTATLNATHKIATWISDTAMPIPDLNAEVDLAQDVYDEMTDWIAQNGR